MVALSQNAGISAFLLGPCAISIGPPLLTSTANCRPSSHWRVRKMPALAPEIRTFSEKCRSSPAARGAWRRNSKKGEAEVGATVKVRPGGIARETRPTIAKLPELGTSTKVKLRSLPARVEVLGEAVRRNSGKARRRPARGDWLADPRIIP